MATCELKRTRKQSKRDSAPKEAFPPLALQFLSAMKAVAAGSTPARRMHRRAMEVDGPGGGQDELRDLPAG